MRRTVSLLAFLVSIASIIPFAGCDDGPTEPAPVAGQGLAGVVVDGDGRPLEGVAIGIGYELVAPTADPDRALPAGRVAAALTYQFQYPVEATAHVRIWVTDYAGDPVITLLDDTKAPGYYFVNWQGVEEDGDPVPAGVYYGYARVGDGEPFVYEVFLAREEPGEILLAPNAVTDPDGKFTVPDDLIPVGEVVPGGMPDNEMEISGRLRVVAVKSGDTIPLHTSVEIEYETGMDNCRLEIVLP